MTYRIAGSIGNENSVNHMAASTKRLRLLRSSFSGNGSVSIVISNTLILNMVFVPFFLLYVVLIQNHIGKMKPLNLGALLYIKAIYR